VLPLAYRQAGEGGFCFAKYREVVLSTLSRRYEKTGIEMPVF